MDTNQGSDGLITVDMIMGWRPCDDYQLSIVQELVGGGLTPLEICDLPIPPDDRLWVLLRREVLDDQTLRGIACRAAERALCRYGALQADGTRGDPRSWEAVRVAQLYAASQASNEELFAACGAAWDAARDAWDEAWDEAWASTRASTRAAAWAAERDAAWDAARDAAWAAARDAAWDAARDALDEAWDEAWDEVLADVRAVLGGAE